MQEEPVAALSLCSCREDARVHPGEAGVPAPEKRPGSAPWALPPLLRLVAKGPGAGRSTAPAKGGAACRALPAAQGRSAFFAALKCPWTSGSLTCLCEKHFNLLAGQEYLQF